MKEHKNPKVLSEGILWMVSAVEDFGVSHLKLKVVLFSFNACVQFSSVNSWLWMPIALCKFQTYIIVNIIFFYFFSQDLIDFCKDTGLQSSAAATRNATIKLIGALHKYVGPGN